MIGTIVNTGTILAGSLLGSALKKGINEKYQDALYTAMGLAATGMSITAIPGMLLYLNGQLPQYLIACAIGFVVAFVLTTMFYKPKEDE